MADPIMVYPLVASWRFFISSESLGGNRVYLESSVGLSVPSEQLPKIGDPWDIDYPNVTLKSIEVTFLNDNPNCGKQYNCSYDGVPYNQQAQIQEEKLLITVDVGGEMRAFEPKGSLWKWVGTGTIISSQNLSKRVVIANIRMYRPVKDFDDYMRTVMSCAGKLANHEFHGFPIGTVLFLGANMSEFKNRFGFRRWNAELLFAVKSCTGLISNGTANADGWTYDLREDGNSGIVDGWDRPYIPGSPNKYMYEYTNFGPLFSQQQLGDDENLFQPYPNK
jgi:hypothetical protein